MNWVRINTCIAPRSVIPRICQGEGKDRSVDPVTGEQSLALARNRRRPACNSVSEAVRMLGLLTMRCGARAVRNSQILLIAPLVSWGTLSAQSADGHLQPLKGQSMAASPARQAAGEASMQIPACETLRNAAVAGLDVLQSIQGVGIAIFSPDDSCAFGLGVTDIDTQENVTADTAFYIASSTESMFALSLASMDARGELDLDQPIAEFAPSAPFSTRIHTDRITLRHLLAMSSGIKNPAYVHRVAYSGEHSQDQLWALIAETKPNRSPNIRFGKFRYTNWNYNLAARLVEEEHGILWQEILAKEIFDKLEMTRTTAYMSQAVEEGWSIARPHSTLEPNGTVRTYLEKTDATMHSAGGVITSANDALKWLEVLIEDGQLDGQQLFSPEVVRSTRQCLTEVNAEYNGFNRDCYGLGWYVGPYRDTSIALFHHFGGFSGAKAHVSYMPGRRLGVAVFVNDSAVGAKFADAFADYVYSQQLGLDGSQETYSRDIAEIREWTADIRNRLKSLRMEIAARPTRLRHTTSAYAGVYANQDFGTFEVDMVDDRLRFTNGQLIAIAQSGTEPETVRVELVPLEGEKIQFQVSRRGEVRSFEIKGVRYDRQD